MLIYNQNDRDLSRKYLYAMTDMVKQIHEMGKPIIMGINGKNVAGGAVFAMTADYRIMKQGATLHYIEAAVNIAIVRFIFECVSRVVGSDIASYVFQTAIPLKSQKCLDLGLVNELVDDEQQLIKRAIHVLENEYFNANIKAAAAARYLGREYYIDYINDSNRGKRDIEALCDTFHSDRVQKYIKQFLKARKSKL